MPPAVVDGILGRRKAWVGKCAHGDSYRLFLTFFGVEHICSAYRTEPESEFGSLISGAYVLSGCTDDFVRRGEGGQSREDASGSPLTREAMTDSDAKRFAMNFNPELAAGTRGSARRH
jgi:hypothetical protein